MMSKLNHTMLGSFLLVWVSVFVSTQDAYGSESTSTSTSDVIDSVPRENELSKDKEGVGTAPKKSDEVEIDKNSEFKGLGFGIGVSLTVDTGNNRRVQSANVVDGIVRIQDEDDTLARIMLESHYFRRSMKNDKVLWFLDADEWAHGPFVAIRPGSDEAIDAIGFGWMLGLKREGVMDKKSNSWNLGVGVVFDQNVQVLGEGIVANQPLPGNETEIRFAEKTQAGLLIMSSFSW